jgi:hypothetical protein
MRPSLLESIHRCFGGIIMYTNMSTVLDVKVVSRNKYFTLLPLVHPTYISHTQQSCVENKRKSIALGKLVQDLVTLRKTFIAIYGNVKQSLVGSTLIKPENDNLALPLFVKGLDIL